MKIAQINKDVFVKYINSLIENERVIKIIHELGIAFNVFESCLLKPQQILHDSVFTPNQLDTIDWWLWDAPHHGEKPENCYIYDTKTKEVIANLLTPEDLYDYLNITD